MTQTGANAHLKQLAEKAQSLLRTRGGCVTEGAKLALTDALEAALRALTGEGEPPFVRNREFYAPREDEAVRFATKRYTMAPTYNREGRVYHEYGLEPALEWFEQQDLAAGGEAKLREKAAFVVGTAEELLASASFGSGVGDYDAGAGELLRRAAARVKAMMAGPFAGEDLDAFARAVADCFDRLRDFRYSRVLRSDVDPESTLYMTRDELERLKNKAESDPLLREQYARIKAIAETYSLDYIQQACELFMQESMDYDRINQRFYAWSSTDKIVNFKAPGRATQAAISFVLPAEENEEDGLGHVWIDDVDIFSANGGSLGILNGGFDEGEEGPLHWRAEALQGRPVLRWESAYPFCGGGDRCAVVSPNPSSQTAANYREGGARRSLYICNPTRRDEGAWTYEFAFPIEGGVMHTLTFAAKLDGKLKRGLRARIVFMDEAGAVVDTFEYDFNRKSSLANGCFQLTMQCDAIVYAMTGDETYARKAKCALLYTLNDFCQGAEHWLVKNERPQGSDSYGAVQGGRLLCSAAVTYSFIKRADVFAPEEKKRFDALVDYMLRYMLDLRDRSELPAAEAQRGCSNWQTDMCAGTAYMMLALDDFPNRKTWLYNAHAVLKAQLESTVNADRSWPESIRYHHAALDRFAGYALVARHMMGEDWFAATPLAGMFAFPVEAQTPGYAYFQGRIGTPPFGDHALGDGSEFGYFPTYIEAVEQVDKPLADRMHHTWRLAGKPFKRFWGEAIAFHHLLGPGEGYQASEPLVLHSAKDFPNAGIYIFRNGFGTDKPSYFAIMSSPKPVAHGHLDQGSFVLYKNAVPLVMDSGIEGYFDASTNWHISSYSHACLQFATRRTHLETPAGGSINLSAGTYSLERGWADVPKTSKVLECNLGAEEDSIRIEIGNPEGEGAHVRHVRYIKPLDVYLIRDTVLRFQGQTLFNLPVAAVRTSIEGNRAYSEGAYDVDLEVVFLSRVDKLWLEQGRSTKFFESGHGAVSMMHYIRATADAAEGFLVVLHPKEREQGRLEAVLTPDGTAVDLRTGGGQVRVVL